MVKLEIFIQQKCRSLGKLKSKQNFFVSLHFTNDWTFVSRFCCLCSIVTGKLATHDIDIPQEETIINSAIERGDVIKEEDETSSSLPPPDKTTTLQAKKYTWRIDLAKTERHWAGWFNGLSVAFLNVPAPKMLLLAGVDRLDRDLTVGQMQGLNAFYGVVLNKFFKSHIFIGKS